MVADAGVGGYSQLIGGVLGSGFAAAGAYISERKAKKTARRVRIGVRKAVRRARTEAAEKAEAILSSDEFRTARDFILSQFTGTGLLSGEQSFVNRLRQQQSSRGMFFSAAAARDEALGAANFRFQRQASLLPQLFGLASSRQDFETALTQSQAAFNVFQQTGGRVAFGQPTGVRSFSPLGALFTGAASGFGAGVAGANAVSTPQQQPLVVQGAGGGQNAVGSSLGFNSNFGTQQGYNPYAFRGAPG
jgi:hypothetical protein